jgi:hypothetical protein
MTHQISFLSSRFREARHWIRSLVVMSLFGVNAFGQITTEALLDTIQHTAFSFFWSEANPANGLVRDRSQSGAPCSIASTGFGLSAICIGIDHGWVSRAAGRDRVLTTLKTFWSGPQGSGDAYIGNYGLFYHFLDMTTARRTWNSELSTIDTGLLLAGIVDAREYFDGKDSIETLLRALADSIYARMNWDLMRNYHPGILMGWMPGHGFSFDDGHGNIVPYSQWVGYNEASIMYILAMGAPTYPVDMYGWQTWTSGYQWDTQYGYSYVTFPPLFGHQYSQCWLDLRSIADDYMRSEGITYFENSRRATLAQRAYCTANPGHFAGYSDSLWGITASDTPTGYAARGAPPPQNDDGTITPTAPISSIAFAPEVVLPVIRNMWTSYRSQLWTPYGFRDAFNLSVAPAWWDTDIIGIDQGPIIMMIENYRNGSVWKRFMQNANVQRGLEVAGFIPVVSVRREPLNPEQSELFQNYPNPFNPSTEIRYVTSHSGKVSLTLYNLLGQRVAVLVDRSLPAGEHQYRFDASNLPAGVYFYTLRIGTFSETKRMVLVR